MNKIAVGAVFALSLLLPLLIFAPAFAAPKGERIGIAAVVNDEPITFSDIRNRTQLYVAGRDKPRGDDRKQLEKQILNRLIDEKLQMKEAAGLGITVSEEEVSAGFADIAGQNGLSAEEFRKKLMASGVRPQTLYDQIRAEIAWGQVVRRKLRPQINVSEGEIDTEFDQIARGAGKTEYQVAEIFLPIAEGKLENDVRTEVEKLVKQITKGASFSQVARQFSQAPGAAQGGDLGWVQQGQLEQKLDAALPQMQPGQLSPPIRGEKGYHILFLRNKRQGGLPTGTLRPLAATTPAASGSKSGDIVHLKQILIPVSPKEPQPVVNAKLARAESLAAEISDCAAMEEKSRDFISDATGDLGKGPVTSLPPELRPVVAALPVGKLSAPIKAPNGIAVVMVCAREEGSTPVESAQPEETPLPKFPTETRGDEAAREKIANKLGSKRLDQMQERYLRDLRASAYIDRRI